MRICCYMIMHCIPFAFSQCFMYLDVCLNVENCVLLGLGWVESMMQFLLARYMFVHFSYMHTLSFLPILFWIVMLCLSVSLSLSLSDRLRMAPKRKSTPSRNPLCPGTSSSDLTLTHIRFRDGKAHQDFLENFSKRGIHSKRHVVLSNFSNTALPTIIHSQE